MTNPVAGSQASVVQALLSFIITGTCVIAPVEELQASVVQALPSSVFFKIWNIPFTGSQPSIVHRLLSFTETDI